MRSRLREAAARLGPRNIRKRPSSARRYEVPAIIVLLVIGGSSAAALTLAPNVAQVPPPAGPLGIGSFGDTMKAEFQQGWRNGTDTYGRNDHVVPRDEFGGSYIDPNLWGISADARGASSHVNGSLRHQIGSPGTTENNSLAILNGMLTGDFDVRVDFRLTDWVNSFGMGAFLGVCPASTGCSNGPPYLAGRANFSGTETYVGYDPPNGAYMVPSSNSSGSLRLTRAGSVLQSAFWNVTSGTWTVLFTNATGPVEDMMLLFGIHENDTDPTPSGPVSAEFDNFAAEANIADAPFSPPFSGPPIQDAVRLLPFNDNFDDGFRNPDRWADPVIVDGITAETGGILNQTCSDSGGLENVQQNLREALTGDFDLRVRLDLATVPQTGTWRATLGAGIGADDYQVNRARGAGIQRYEAWAAGVLGATALTTDVESGLRLARSGTTLTFYYGEEGDWTTLQASTVTADPATISLRIRCTGSPYPPLSVEFDHFQVSRDRGMAPATYVDAMFESRVIDTGETAPSEPQWGDLFFNATLGPATSIRLQLASSDSAGGPWNFIGPDGTAATWYTGSGVPAILLNGDRYFRYRAELNSTNATATPVLWDVSVTASGPNIPEFSGIWMALAGATFIGLSAAGRVRGRARAARGIV